MQEPTLYRLLPFAMTGGGPFLVELVIVAVATVANAAVLATLAFGVTAGVLEAFKVISG